VARAVISPIDRPGAYERFNRRLKEECGDRNVMVRGAQRVMSHRMFGVISLFADHLLKLEIS
jgi:hypothetical protein